MRVWERRKVKFWGGGSEGWRFLSLSFIEEIIPVRIDGEKLVSAKEFCNLAVKTKF